MDFALQTINVLADLLITLIFIRVVLSWFVPPSNGLMRFMIETTEPIIGPIRKVTPRLGMLDLSPLLAFLLIDIIRNLLNNFLI